jgi:hypothetical protein
MGATNGMRQLVRPVASASRSGGDWSDKQKQAISSFADATLAAARRVQSTRKAYQSVEDSIKSLATTAGRRMADIKTDVLLNMRQIEPVARPNSAQGKREVAKNFNAAATRSSWRCMPARSVPVRAPRRSAGICGRRSPCTGSPDRQATHYIQSPIGDLQGKPTPSTLGNAGGQPGKAGGGWIGSQGMRGQDTVPVMLGAGEAVLNRHQQGVVEGCSGQGFLDRLFSKVRTPHYMARGGYVEQPQMMLAAGGRIPAVSVRGDLGAVSTLAQRAVNVDRAAAQRCWTRRRLRRRREHGWRVSAHGLVAQVKRAIAWARGHGWSGSVTSGLRSTAKQQYLWDHASQLGLVRGVSVARPGTSEHERGRAIDVSDIGGFQRAMASAPPGARLLWRGPSDPVHFSVSGHARGGFIKSVAANLGGGGISVRQGFVTQHGGLAFAPLTVGLHGKAPAGLGPGPVSRANAMIARAQMPWDQADTDQENSLIVQGIDPEGAQGIGVRALSAQTRLISLRAQRKRLVAARKQAQRSGNKAGARHASAAIKAIDSRILAQRASITQLGTAYAEATAPAPVDDTADTSAADNAQALIDSLNTLNDTLRNMGAITASVGASQHATILQGLADYFSGQIGSSAFLASQTPATAGVRSRY